MPSPKEVVIKEQGVSHRANQRDGQVEPKPLPLLSAFTTASYLPYCITPAVKRGALGGTLVGLNDS